MRVRERDVRLKTRSERCCVFGFADGGKGALSQGI